MKNLFPIVMVIFLLSSNLEGQSNKLNIEFNTNVELLGFMYFLGFEGIDIENKTMEIDGKTIPKKDWHEYGYRFYKEYQSYQNSENLFKALTVADHLWLDYLNLLLLQLDDAPNAKITDSIKPISYIQFSKSRNPEEAREKVDIFLNGFNAFYKEVDFGAFLKKERPYYDIVLKEIHASLPNTNFIAQMEDFFKKSFESYNLIPSLTTPKGMGFGLRTAGDNVYNVFGAVDWQKIEEGKMGFASPQGIRELSIHEFGHSFVNPVVGQLPDNYFKTTEHLLEPIQKAIYEQGYNTWKVCLYEHFVRASELILSKKHDTAAAFNALEKEYIGERQFIYIPQIISVLQNYSEKGLSFEEAIEQSMVVLQSLDSSTTENETPCELNWHTEDVELFWQLYDEMGNKQNGKIWQERYLEQGSPAVKAFIKNRLESGAKLAKTLKKNKTYYENIRATSLNLDEYKSSSCEAFEKLKSLYPAAIYPDIYFVVGRKNTGGTAFNGGLIIGIEMYGKATKNFTPNKPMEYLEFVIAHELIHFQQKYARNNSLLAQCIREGAADLLGEILSGQPNTEKETYTYGTANEKRLKAEFQQKMLTNNWQGWLYYQKDKSRPKDLGYWIGYQICKAYYDKAADKKQAIYDILNIQNFEVFLDESGYLAGE